MRRRALTFAGAVTLAAVPATAHAAGGAALLSAVNYERQVAGVAPLTESSDLSHSCQLHAGYMAGNSILTHNEDPTNGLYTADGAWAGQHAVLARTPAGFATNPWHDAPLHEFQLLHPWLKTTGMGIDGKYACMVTLGTRDAPNPADTRLVTVPGPAQYMPPAQIARELPFTPGEDLGIPQGAVTGPHLYLYLVGPQHYDNVVVRSATLTAADGSQADLRWVDSTSAKSGRYVAGGAILIPPSPLAESTTYTLKVEATTTSSTGTTLQISRTTSFNTGPNELDPAQLAEAAAFGSAASARPGAGIISPSQLANAQLKVSLTWTPQGVRARISCGAGGIRCTGKFRVLVKRRGHKLQKLRFKARPGALKLNLAPGRTITRRIDMTPPQRRSAQHRGFSVRFGGEAPVSLASRIR